MLWTRIERIDIKIDIKSGNEKMFVDNLNEHNIVLSKYNEAYQKKKLWPFFLFLTVYFSHFDHYFIQKIPKKKYAVYFFFLFIAVFIF